MIVAQSPIAYLHIKELLDSISTSLIRTHWSKQGLIPYQLLAAFHLLIFFIYINNEKSNSIAIIIAITFASRHPLPKKKVIEPKDFALTLLTRPIAHKELYFVSLSLMIK